MECYVCHKSIARSEYTRHIGSHLAGNATKVHDPPNTTSGTSDDYYGHDPHDVLSQPIITDSDSYRRGHFTIPSHSQPRATAVYNRSSHLGVSGRQSTPPNAFQEWLQNYTGHFPAYTTIDGQKRGPDLSADRFMQPARVLRVTTRQEVVKIVTEFEGFSARRREICLGLVRNVPIFPGLVAYTYTHLVMCPYRGWLSSDDWSDRESELERLVEQWKHVGDIACILSYDTIKKRLLDLLHRTQPRSGKHSCNPKLLDGTMMLSYDILNLASLAALCITGSQKELILSQSGVQEQKFVELFHDLLAANVELEEWYRRCFFNAVILFSKVSGCCPRGIYLSENGIDGLVSEREGGFGFVYKGRLGSCLVAVKAIKRRNSVDLSEYNKQLAKEAIVWTHLRHPNCLPFYGVYSMQTGGPDISVALVSPWMDQGNLSKYLERNPGANLTKLMLDVVRGLDYLHSMQPHVAHRDIKPDNILITTEGRACLADFGLASAFDTDVHFRTAPDQILIAGTTPYMAPEMFEARGEEAKRKVNKRACDMYALGCTIYEAYTGRYPFEGVHHPGSIRAYVLFGERPEFPEGKISTDMWSFVERLWCQDPMQRLTAQASLSWMEEKARREGLDLRPTPLEEEWRWRPPLDNKCLWYVGV